MLRVRAARTAAIGVYMSAGNGVSQEMYPDERLSRRYPAATATNSW